MAEDQRRSHDTGGGHAQRAPLRGPSGVSQRGRPRAGGRSQPSSMMRFVDSMMSPFVQCWQPPLDACGTGCADVPVCGSGTTARPPPVNSTSARPVMVTPTASCPPTRRVPPPPVMFPATQPHLSPRMETEYPSEVDVLCGRGGSSNRHNAKFRELVAANKAVYTTLTKKQKMMVSRQVVDTIHRAGGRFLAKNSTSGRWQDIGLPRSLEKASQALREKTTNNGSVFISDDGIEAMVDEDTSSRPNPNRTVEAPPLIIPNHLKHFYGPKPAPVTPTFDQDNPGWVAEFPPMEQQPQSNNPYSPVPHQSYHPSDRTQSMPAPHMGALPFTTRQMSRLGRKSSRVRSNPASSNSNNHPVVSPHHGMSWQQHPTPMETDDYPSSATSCNSGSSATHSAPEFHQYYNDFQPPRGDIHVPATNTRRHPPPHQEHFQEIKRQRTREEEEREQQEEEELILVDNDHKKTLNNSLTEGSHQLPEEVASKLSLQDKVICSPSGMIQSRSFRPPRGEYHRISDSIKTGTANVKKHLNTSAEAEGLAGLAALSTAAYLRLDEGE